MRPDSPDRSFFFSCEEGAFFYALIWEVVYGKKIT